MCARRHPAVTAHAMRVDGLLMTRALHSKHLQARRHRERCRLSTTCPILRRDKLASNAGTDSRQSGVLQATARCRERRGLTAGIPNMTCLQLVVSFGMRSAFPRVRAVRQRRSSDCNASMIEIRRARGSGSALSMFSFELPVETSFREPEILTCRKEDSCDMS